MDCSGYYLKKKVRAKVVHLVECLPSFQSPGFNCNTTSIGAWWHIPIIPVLRRWQPEDQGFTRSSILSYIVNPKPAPATWDHLLFFWKLSIGEGKRSQSHEERLACLLSCLNKVTWRYISDFLVHLFFLETDVFCLRHIMGTQQYTKQSPDLTGLTSQWGLSSAHRQNSSSHLPLRVWSVRWHKVNQQEPKRGSGSRESPISPQHTHTTSSIAVV